MQATAASDGTYAVSIPLPTGTTAAGIVAQSLIRYGTPVQQSTWLPQIRAGEIHFSLCYSEPEAGSDLASLRLRAEKNPAGSHYLLIGQKCWQSYAQDMDYLWVLGPTGTQDSRGRGLSLFICDKQAGGVTVSPLPTVDGDQLNEVFFDGVEVPADGPRGRPQGARSARPAHRQLARRHHRLLGRRRSWLLLAVRSDYAPAEPRLESFLVSTGRHKMIKRLYEELAGTEARLAVGCRIYARARPGYHPAARQLVDGIMRNCEAVQ